VSIGHHWAVPTYVALLRGINLGPRNKIAMADLRDLLDSLGLENVRTHILSGNAIFTSRRRSASRLESLIERRIKKRFGFEIRVLVRTLDEIARVVEDNPLPAAMPDGSRLFVLFLDRNPDRDRIEAIDPADFRPEEFRVGDRVIYAWFKWGLQGSKLSGALTDKRLGVALTNRNWNTVTKLLELARETSRGLDRPGSADRRDRSPPA
jgi:uncharacterized protein (DUF1697 family)